MPLSSSHTVAGTIDTDDLLEVGLKVVENTVEGPPGVFTTVRTVVGFVRYRITQDDPGRVPVVTDTHEAQYNLTGAEKTNVRNILQTKAVAAIKAKEGLPP